MDQKPGAGHIDLPPYSPELNPCEQLWDIVKDDIANRIYATVATLRVGMQATLRRFWDDPPSVLSLVGRPWLAKRFAQNTGVMLI